MGFLYANKLYALGFDARKFVEAIAPDEIVNNPLNLSKDTAKLAEKDEV